MSRTRPPFDMLSGSVACISTDVCPATRTARVHSFGKVEFPECTDPTNLLALTRRALERSGRVCTNAHYQAAGCTPWYDQRASVRLATFAADLAAATIASIDYWFYSHTTLLTVAGWGNVRGLTSLRYAMNGCSALASLDMTGLDPSSLRDLFYAFAQCGSLEAIYVDGTWALPSGCSGMGTFYNDTKLKGGYGTSYSSTAYGYARIVIDKAGQAGYLTAAS